MSTIALITDFGTTDYFVGAMKGVILSINENARIIDITHEIPPQNIKAASFNLRACYKNFPEKTIFVAVVDPGVGSDRRPILVETTKHYFIAPDNGLLSFVFNEEKNRRVFEITNDKFFRHPVSRTFHGRDIFASVAAHLSNKNEIAAFGSEIIDYVSFENASRKKSGGNTEGEILYIDHFGNLITNLSENDLPEKFTLEIKEVKISKRRAFFAEAEENELFTIIGSADFLEVVAFRDSAARLTGAKVGQAIILRDDTGK